MDLEQLVSAAEDAIMAADAAVTAVVDASDDGAAEDRYQAMGDVFEMRLAA